MSQQQNPEVNRFLMATILLALGSGPLGCGTHTPSPPPQEREIVSATLLEVASETVPLTYQATGTIQAETTASLASRTLGQIVTIRVREGDLIRQGQLLVEIDNRDYSARAQRASAALQRSLLVQEEMEQNLAAQRAAFEAAQAQQTLAESTFERYQNLLDRGSISQQEYDEAATRYQTSVANTRQAEQNLGATRTRLSSAQAQITEAQAALAEAEIQLDFTRLVAPFSGRVVKQHLEVGDLATPGSPLLTLEDDRPFQLEAAIAESLLPSLKLGQTVLVQVPALSLETNGAIHEILPTSNPLTRSFQIKVALQLEPGLRSGLFGRVKFTSGHSTVLLIPQTALVRRGQLVGVFVVNSERLAQFRLLQLGRQQDHRIEVLAGLKAGESIVVDPGPQMRDGVRVQ